jgi:dolichol-phosphate mannosyltransferase
MDVVRQIGPEVARIFVVDDACPEGTGTMVEQAGADPRIEVLRHQTNQGVGAATITGMRAAVAGGADIVVKLDGDGQMDPALIPRLVRPVAMGDADYAKGNRFYDPASLRNMPVARLVGNAILSFITKFSTGYWDVFDPTNGFTAIHAKVAGALPLDRVARRFFFESDMLFRLNIARAVVVDVPMNAVYGSERSNLSVTREFFRFIGGHLRNLSKRIFYTYVLRDFSIASVELFIGVPMLAFGLIFGLVKWQYYASVDVPAPTGTVMLASLSMIIGLQLMLSFLSFDMANVPRRPLHKRL